MQSYYIKPKAFYDSFGDVQPSQPYSYTYGDRPTFEFAFLPNEIAEGDTLVFAVDNDMVFYDSEPENILHSASCMVVVRHDVTADEATAGKVQMRIETRTLKFRDVTNGKVRPVEVISGLYRKRGSDYDINYVLLAMGRAFANGIIADYDTLPEPITTDEYYTKDEINDRLSEKADEATLVAHTDDATIHVTQQEKTEWSNKADRNDIGTATVTITQGGTSKGSFSVNASENVTIEVNDGAQADWDETDTTSPSYIQNKPSVYTKTETNSLLDDKADIDHLHTGKYVPLEENNNIPGSYFLRGSLSNGGNLSTNGFVNATTGFKLKNVSLDNIYAAKSHTHAMGDITGLPASGGTAGQVLTKTETGSEWDYLPDDHDYLCFTATQANSTAGMKKVGTPPTINLEYSTDKKHWTEYTWNDKTGAIITLATIGDKVWWRGNNTAFSLDINNAYCFTMSGSIEASGNVMSLLDKTCKSVTIPTSYCFFALFSLCSSLTTAPKLPATTLTDSCYYGMFNGCSSLMEAPELPANTLAEYCYDWMFHNCTSLMEAPELPATTMIEHCYDGMFQGCTSLTKAPELPATTLANWCYQNMFKGCSKINKVKVSFTSWNGTPNWLSGASSTGVFQCPSALDCATRDDSHVPAGWTIVRTDAPASGGTIGQVLTKTADGQEWADAPAGGGGEDTTDYLCFTAGQANSTVNLKKNGTPDAITLEYSTDGKQTWTDYAWDTNDGTTITLANANDAVFFRAKSTNAHTGKGWSDYHHFVFSGVIFASGNVMSLLDKTCTLMEVIDKFCFVYLFSSNYLYSAPKLPATKLTGERCYAGMFSGCKSLKEMPDLPAIILSKWCYNLMFSDCTSLVAIKNIPLVPMVEGCFDSMFKNCNALRKMPELPATKLARSCYSQMFMGCASLEDTTVLPATTLPEDCYYGMFQYCKSLKKVPQIKATTFSDADIRGVFESMFYGCTNLIDGDFGVPIDVTKSRILFETFNNCPSLEKAPSFKGATVGTYAFTRAFKGCTSLHYIKPSWTTWNTKNPSADWFDNASQTGIFDCSASLDTTTYVPTGWTVTHGANEPNDNTTSVVEAMTTDIYTVCPSSKETGVLTVSSTLTLNAYPVSSTDIAYAEIVIDVATGATVTAGSNLTLVDTPESGMRNICVCRWSGGVCKLYVSIVEDLPQA